jgi:hypothetical protein
MDIDTSHSKYKALFILFGGAYAAAERGVCVAMHMHALLMHLTQALQPVLALITACCCCCWPTSTHQTLCGQPDHLKHEQQQQQQQHGEVGTSSDAPYIRAA